MSDPTTPEPATRPGRTPSARSQSSRATKKSKGQDAPLPRPAPGDRENWKAYWEAQGHPWRTEPEIDEERQTFLAKRRAIRPDTGQGVYPFKDIPLSRADVEWLLANHAGGHWIDESLLVTRDYSWPEMGPDLRGANLRGADLHRLPLMRLFGGLRTADWLGHADAQRQAAAIQLTEAQLYSTHLEQARLRGANLEWANLRGAHLQGARLTEAHLEGAILTEVFFDAATNLDQVTFADGKQAAAFLLDVHWGGVNLSAVKWSSVIMSGEEQLARQRHNRDGNKSKTTRLIEYGQAIRANRQLATVLREQGLNEVADYFAYRAQLGQRTVMWHQHQFLKCLGSWLLWLIAGYGYRPLRSLLIYLALIGGFATTYFLLGPQVHVPFSPLGAIVFSVTSFHGRGFFPGGSPGHSITLDDPLTVVAAAEAVVGLLIEVSFIATFTQRFFGR
jgi:hypothetical protein